MCSAVAGILDDEGCLTLWHLDDYIPGQVFAMAVYAEIISEPPKPPEGHGVFLGDFKVEREYRDGFKRLLKDSLDELRELVTAEYESTESYWHEPTPRQIIDQFRHERSWSLEKFTDEARKFVDGSVRFRENTEPLSKRSIERLMHQGHVAAPHVVLALGKLMNIDWHELEWRPK